MDWTFIKALLTGLLSGGGIMAIINWRSSKRKAAAEASQSEAQSTDTAVGALNKAIDTLQEERDHDRSIIDKLTKEREALTKDKIDLINRLGALKVCMCVHLGCILRKPTQGQADKWIEDHSGEELYGADYTPVNILFRRLNENDGNNN
ncbi:MAG: hypothetical protein PUK70_01650 [Bacteroidales bacterium]|nr:hypothetical protein [Bacteroidales bacterium]MDY6002661.1 hypothetical protein [Candidatus Cryptobacteroides sp.]